MTTTMALILATLFLGLMLCAIFSAVELFRDIQPTSFQPEMRIKHQVLKINLIKLVLYAILFGLYVGIGIGLILA